MMLNKCEVCGGETANIIDLIVEHKLHILVITETWLHSHDDAKMKEITPDGYELHRNLRDSRRSAVVAILCKSNFKCEIKLL